MIKRGSFHPKHVGSIYIVIVVDVVQVCHPLSVMLKNGTICDGGPRVATNLSLVDQKNPGLNHNYEGSRMNEKLEPLGLNISISCK
jgi:hypothetical protein